MPVAGVDEVRNLFCRFGIDDTAKFWRTARRVAKHAARVRNHAHLDTSYARVSGDDLFSIVRLKLVQMSVVEHAIQQLAHVVRLAMIFRNNFVKLLFRILGSAPLVIETAHSAFDGSSETNSRILVMHSSSFLTR